MVAKKDIQTGMLVSPRGKYGGYFSNLSDYEKGDDGIYRSKSGTSSRLNRRFNQKDRLILEGPAQIETKYKPWSFRAPVAGSWEIELVDYWIVVHPKHGKFLVPASSFTHGWMKAKNDNDIDIKNLKSRLNGRKRSLSAARDKYERKKKEVRKIYDQIVALGGEADLPEDMKDG